MLQFMGLQRVGHDLATDQQQQHAQALFNLLRTNPFPGSLRIKPIIVSFEMVLIQPKPHKHSRASLSLSSCFKVILCTCSHDSYIFIRDTGL